MADLYDGLQLAPQTPRPPPAPPGMYEGLQEVTPGNAAVREPQSLLEYAQSGFQASALGLAWRRKLPDLVMNPETARWWERAAAGFSAVGADLPFMIGGTFAGAPAGTAAGGAVAGPTGAIVGGILGAGAGMFAVPGFIRESLIQAYSSGDVMTAADWWNAIRAVAATTVKEAGIGAVTFGAGATAARVAGKAIAPAITTGGTVGTATKAIGTADIAAQILAMTTMPAALEGRLPDAIEIMDAAIVIGGLKAAHVTAARIANVYARTGKTPAQQVADAQADAKVAEELTRGPAPDVPVPRETDGRVAMPTIQETLFRDQARQAELEEAQAARPLADPERAELTALRGRIADLEARIAAGEPPSTPAEAAPEAALTPQAASQAKGMAEARLAELEAKAASQSLADTERAERIFIRNNLERPEALARHFGIAAEAPARITLEAREASAQRVYDDVLQQVRAADQARKDSGLEPLGDEHALAVAALVRARVRTRAERLGMLPEDVYRERPLQVQDATAAELAKVEAEAPPEAPRYELPEVDLFGEPIAAPVVPRLAVEGLATVEVPLANLVLSKDVPQFKAAANVEGVVVPLGGRFDRTGVGPIQVWERLDGRMEVISGRHRLDLARRSGETTIPAQIHREADGFDVRQAATLDAQLNIREEQGSVADYAQYFKDAGLTKEAADELGLLARAKGRTGYAIARDGSSDLTAAHRAGLLSDEAALSISAAAPGSERLQALGIAMVQEGKSILIAVNTMKAVELMASERMAAGTQGDIFGFDDSAMREASAMAKAASSRQRKIGEQIAAVSGASKRPELARKMGVNVEDPEAVRAKIVELRQEQELWDNWPLHPELVVQLREIAKSRGVTGREGDLKQGPVLAPDMLKPEIEDTPEAKRYIEELRAQIRAGEDLGPILVDEANPAHIVDGNHRLTAYREEGIQPEVVPVDRLQTIQAMGSDPTITPRMIAERTAAKARAPEARDWMDAPTDEAAYVTDDAIYKLEAKPYVADNGLVTANSRNVPNPETFPPVGTWRISTIKGAYGREIEQLVEIPLASLKLTELDSKGRLDPVKAGDEQRYAEWLKEGKRAPPINVVQTDRGTLNVTNGHRRALAAELAGAKTIEAWVNYAVPTPSGGRYNGDPTKPFVRTGMTYEMLTGEVRNPFLDRIPLEASFELKPETPAELEARNREAAEQAKRKMAAEAAAERAAKGLPPRVDQADLFNTQGTLFQDVARGPTWYSELERQIDTTKMKQAPAQGWKDLLRGLKGVKPDEIKWSGLEEWLDLQQGKVSKDDVLAYLRSNGVKVTETMKGGPLERTPQDAQIAADVALIKEHGLYVDQDPTGRMWGVVDPEGDIYTTSGMANPADFVAGRRLTDAIDRVADYLNEEGAGPQTKFGSYQLPGGENYRELLLTLPTFEKNGLPQGYEVQRMRNGEYTLVRPDGTGVILRGAAGLDDPAQVASVARDQLRSMGVIPKGTTFTSSHFDEPNILAHVRFNERTDAEGKRVLFVEEFQSDWAQKGKKEGFKRDELITTAQYDRVNELAGKMRAGTITEVEREEYTRLNSLLSGDANRVPSAPFVGKTDAWVALTLKRMIRYAAENGYERIAWTTGEQQVSRYTSALRKAVDAIEWKKTPEGVQLVGYKGRIQSQTWYRVVRQDGTREPGMPRHQTEADARSDYEAMTGRTPEADGLRIEPTAGIAEDKGQKVVDTTEREDSLSDAVGKAMADRIRNDPAQTGVIEGENLKIDDTGMAAFYDRIVPNVAKDVLKKLGGGKITETAIRLRENTPEDEAKGQLQPITRNLQFEELDATDRDIFQGAEDFPLGDPPVLTTVKMSFGRRGTEFDATVVLDHNGVNIIGPDAEWTLGRQYPRRMTQDEAINWLDRRWGTDEFWTGLDLINGEIKLPGQEVTTKQLAFDITPAMREKALQGMPLFQQHRGSYQVAENLITIMQGADKSTVVHELTHSWLEEMKIDAARPDAPAQLKADWEILRRELAIPESGEISRASHEQFARSGERYLGEGVAPSIELRSVFERFKAWLLEIYRELRNLNVEINPDLRGVLDRMLATDQEIADARVLDVPRAYVPEAKAELAAKVVTPPGEKKAPEPGFIDEQLSMQPFAEELQAGPGSGATRDSRVNAQYINGPMDLKLAIQQVANFDQANIQARRGGKDGVKSWEQANAEADKLAEDTLGGKVVMETDTPIPHDTKQRAAFKVMVAVAKYSLKLRDEILQKGDNATIQDQFDYLQSIIRMRMAHAEFLGLRAAAARAMNQIRDMTPESGVVDRMVEITAARAGAGPAELFQAAARSAAEEAAALKLKLEQIMAQHFGGRSALDIAKLHADIKDLKAQLAFAKGVTEATKWDMVVEGWKSALLSGPVTHTTNFFGTGAFQVLRAPVDALAAIIGMARGASPGMGESDRASMSESIARIGGMLAGVQDGMKAGAAYFKADEATMKTESYREAIPGRAGELARIPLRLMGAEDAFVSTMYRNGELYALAIRKAFDEGMNPATREFAERVTQLKDAPTEDMVAMADQQATRMTFNAPLGEKGVALQLFVAKWNLQWMIPFIRTPINITKEVARMSPFAPMVGEWRADMRQGGVARDRAIAEAAIGTALMTVTMAYAFSGQISAGGSPDPGKGRAKAGVEQPYSIKIGDKWYEYTRIQPTGTLMGLAADIALAWDHMTEEEKDKVPRLLSRAFASAVTNQTFLQGITNVINAMSDPTRFAPRFLQQLAGTSVPNIIGQTTALADPNVREVNSVVEAIMARIPGLRQELLPRRDWLGEPLQAKERLAVVGPVRIQPISDDKVRLEAARLNISVAAAPKKTHIGKGTGKLGDVELTPEETNRFAQVGGEMAHRILANIVNAPGYDQIPDLVKRSIFSKVLTASHRVAAVAALPPEKRAAYLQSITEKVQAELTPAGAE